METDLRKLIHEYIDTAASFFPRLASHLELELPISNSEWIFADFPKTGVTTDGITYSKHGYGVRMNDGQRFIDLDLGDNGEIDGFDGWRLFLYSEDNGISIGYESDRALEDKLRIEVNQHRLFRSGSLYYLQHK